MRQPSRRGCGVAWEIASREKGDYFIVVDDDLLVYPGQIATLFRALISDPRRPHGLSGKRNGRYVVGQESVVDNLFGIYAVTRQQVETYRHLVGAIVAACEVAAEALEMWSDDVILSRCGTEPPIVHDAGYLLHCRSSASPSVALFRQAGFREQRLGALAALERLRDRERTEGLG